VTVSSSPSGEQPGPPVGVTAAQRALIENARLLRLASARAERVKILVETAEGAGSTFTIRLPVGRPPPGAVTRPSQVGLNSVRVLVIDDEPFVPDTLGEILRQQHHDVVMADDGVSGLARFRDSAFDLVMTDLAMPGMSGWQVAQAVKAARPQVPVVLVTGWGIEVQADELETHGVDRVMTTPFRFEDVQEVVASFRGTGGPT